MSHIQRVGDLEIDQNLPLQQATWVAERAGWIVMAILIVAAVLGLFGPGVFSRVQVASPGGELRASYHRFEHFEAPTTLRIHAAPTAARQAGVELWLSQTMLNAYEVRHITPPPEQTRIEPGRLIYRFNTATSQGPLTIIFHLQTQTFGSQTTQIGLVGGPEVQINQLIYP